MSHIIEFPSNILEEICCDKSGMEESVINITNIDYQYQAKIREKRKES